MNNGNLLSSLLGITNANPAATKATAAKTRAESTEKFQQALEQVRPEVAARKPVARKESIPPQHTERPAPKPVASRHSQHETARANAAENVPANTPDRTQNAAVHTTEKSEAPVRDTLVSESVTDSESEELSVDSQHQGLPGETQQPEGGATGQAVVEVPVAIDPFLLVDSTLGIPDEIALDIAEGVAPVSPENLANPIGAQPLISDDLDLATDVAVSLTPDTAAIIDSTTLAAQSALVSVAPDASASAGLSTEGKGDDLSTILISNQVASPLNTPGGAITDSVVDTQSAAIQAASGVQIGKLVQDGVSIDEAAVNEAGTAEDVLADSDAGVDENPDFLLLNSKAAANKLTETAMAAATLDKTVPVPDQAKPAVVINAAVETLTRLTEAQSPAARAFVVQTGVPVTVGTPQWSQAVGDKVLWLAAQNVSSAEIRLDPPELGPMQVKVSVNQEQASVTFTSPHPAVREALDQQLNRLREMFSEQGLNLVNVDVSDKSFAQREREQNESAKHQGNAEADDEELTPVGITQAISMRLVDHYA